MFQHLICGASTFDHQREDDHDQLSSSSPDLTPRKSRRNSFSKSHNKDMNKNPFSSRGLDKFSALLAELEEKKQKIYSQTGSEDISFVRFTYKNSEDCVPIVVKLKDVKREEDKKKGGVDQTKDHHHHHHQHVKNIEAEVVLDKGQDLISDEKKIMKKKKKKQQSSSSWINIELHKWRRPSYYLPAFLVLILLLLVFFGRSVTILFTCIGWYIVPTIQGESSSNVRRSAMKKKDHARKLSESKLVSEGFSSPKGKRSPVRDFQKKS